MFLKITKKKYKDRIYRHANIVETIRIKGKVQQHAIKNLGVLKTTHDEVHARELVTKIKEGKKIVVLDDVNEYVLEYGVRLVVEHIWHSLTIKPLITSNKRKLTYDINQIIYLLIAHRLHNYGSENISEREGYRWITEEVYHTLSKSQLKDVYRSLFILLSKKDIIEKHLCEKLSQKKEIVFYDLTSSYVEGAYKGSDLVCYGYNRDKKKGKKQIVLGLLVANTLPLAHKVWEGNTADKTTLNEAVKQLQKLGMERFIFVADRGICSDKNIRWLEDQKLEYIIATRRRRDELVMKLMTKPISSKVRKVHKENGRVYYLCYNKSVAKQQIAELKQLKKDLIQKIKSIKKPTEHNVLDALGKTKKFFTFNFKEKFTYKLNEKVWEYEKAIAGKFLLVTNNKELSKKKVVEVYKQLIDIEQCFRQLKHFEDMRPIFHKSDNGIRAHIFLCVLTLLVEKLINKKIPDMATREVITQLKKIKLTKANKYFIRSNLTEDQKKILNKLEVEEPTKVIM